MAAFETDLGFAFARAYRPRNSIAEEIKEEVELK
jgi:hypothetical protein